MLTKAMFCKAMKAIKDDFEQRTRLSATLEEQLLEGWVSIKASPTFEVLIDVLKELFHDTDTYSTIDWWLFDKVDKIIYKADGSCIDVTNVEDLYDYLVSNEL